MKDSLRVSQEAHALEPLIPQYAMGLAYALTADGQADAAISVLDATPPRQGAHYAVAAYAYARAGRFDDAAVQILKINNRDMFAPEAARLIRTAPAKASDPSALPDWHVWLNFVYAYIGAPERLLDYSERALQADQIFKSYRLFTPEYAPVRNTERFKTLVRDMGLVDYWKARGWADLCRPIGTNDFECN